jgi:prepilin-type N-terminal cleavage/methylation domain-containing protein
MTVSGQRGFSLIELVIAVSIFLVLMLGSVTLYTTVLKTNLKDKITQDLQREADFVLASYSQNLREAVSVDAANSNFTINPHILQVNLLSGSNRRYYVTSSQLHYRNEAGVDQTLLQPGTTVSSLTYATTTGADGLKSISIQATLTRTQVRATVSVSIGTTVGTRPQ